jgi:8-oxo-dGTP pyrophosphatase MutT (NUDIX family)
MNREISAGIIVYRKTVEGPKFLVLYHGHNYWNFPKGKIEIEERSLETAIRETKEETGLGNQDLRMAKNFRAREHFYFRREGERIFKIVIFYLAETNKKEIKISTREHQGYGWFLFGEAKKVLGRNQDNQKVLKKAYDFLRQSCHRRRETNSPRTSANL